MKAAFMSTKLLTAGALVVAMLLRFHGIPEELFGRGVLRKSRADQ